MVPRSTGSKKKIDAKQADLAKDTLDVDDRQNMATDHGTHITNPDYWLRIMDGKRTGIMRFDHERIPERVVHARGTGVFGTFKLYESAADVTHAGILTNTTRSTPVFARFLTVQGSKGSSDTVRDVRGFAVKFYTEEGNWDIVGNNIPVFFIQDAIKFPDVIHAVKPEPDNKVPQGQTAHNNLVYTHPDFHRKDLMEAIDKGHFPRWKFGIQVLPEARQDEFEFDLLDATKLWPEEGVPIRYIGTLELNRNVDKFFLQTEQVAFCTSHIVPGIDFSNDPLLQGRNFSYFDTQISRLGPNWEELPINRPVCPYLNLGNRDGAMRHRITQGKVNYWPNRFEANPPAPESAPRAFTSYPEVAQGSKHRALPDKFKEHINQAQLFYNSLTEIEKIHLTSAFSFELDHCDDPLVYKRMSERLAAVSLGLAQIVARNVGGPIPTSSAQTNPGRQSRNLSQLDFVTEEPLIATRRVSILLADGFDYEQYARMREILEKQGAFIFVIGAHRHGVTAHGGQHSVIPDHYFAGMRSTLFDAVYVPGGAHVRSLTQNGIAKHWIAESFAHLKSIAGVNEAVPFIERQIGLEAVKVAPSGVSLVESYGVVTGHGDVDSLMTLSKAHPAAKRVAEQFIWHISRHRNWARELDELSGQIAA
ncbi:catalase-domain-containing protein [Aspergillus spinulosporus]